MSDGNFHRADEEIDNIRETFRLKIGLSCPKECDKGCRSCCPPITYIICQSQNSTRVLPSDGSQGIRVNNGGVNVHR